MNIFVVDPSPLTSAKWLWDRDFKRANKMILESTQMLCTALNGLKPFVNCAKNTKLGLDFTHLPVFDAYKQYLEAKWRLENET